MTSNQDNLQKLEKIADELNCIVCNLTMEDPHALFCGHSFCGQCILTWFKTKKSCPSCRLTVVRQPIHITALQKLADLLRPEGHLPEKRLERSDWLELFPVDNHVTYIRDEDEDGVILRCSQCGWELDEENHCRSCDIQYDIEGHTNETIEVSDTESHNEIEQDLSDFVVDDDEVAYSSDNSDDERLRELDRYTADPHSGVSMNNAIEIDDDDEDDSDAVRFTRKRRARISSDEEESDEEDSNADNSVTYGVSYQEDLDNDPEDVEEISDEDEVEYRPAAVSRFFDDYADEDEEEEEVQPKLPKVDKIMENIAKAKDRMETHVQEVKSSSDTSDDEDDGDAPDYENLFIDSSNKENKAIPKEEDKTLKQKPVQVDDDKSLKKSKKRKHKKNKKAKTDE